MSKKLLLLIIPFIISADGLKSLLDYATANNKIVVSKQLTGKAKLKDIQSSKSAYYPTIDVGAYYQRLDDTTQFTPGDTYSAYAKVGMDLYDGGKKSSTIEQNKALHKSSKYATTSYKKSLQLEIVEDFYAIKSAQSTLDALKDKEAQLQADLERVQKFYDVGSVTIDEIDRLKAEYSGNLYQIEQIKYQIASLKKLLKLKVGKKIVSLDNSQIKVPQEIKRETSDDILVLQANASSLNFSADIINSAYYPKLRIEDTYSLYGYERKSVIVENLDNQNELMLTLNLKLFDMGTVSKQRESLIIQKEALQKEIEQAQDEQDINIELALLKIETTKAQILSAKSSLESASSAYKTIAMKYSVGAVDNVTYLDALSIKTNAKAQYKLALNKLQIAYANYYYYTNQDIKEYIK